MNLKFATKTLVFALGVAASLSAQAGNIPSPPAPPVPPGRAPEYLNFRRNPVTNLIYFEKCTTVGYVCQTIGNPEGYTAEDLQSVLERMVDVGFGLPLAHDSIIHHPYLNATCTFGPMVTGTLVGVPLAGIGMGLAGHQVCKRGIQLENYLKNLHVPKEVKNRYRHRYHIFLDAMTVADNPGIRLERNYDYASMNTETVGFCYRMQHYLEDLTAEKNLAMGRAPASSGDLGKDLQNSLRGHRIYRPVHWAISQLLY